MKYKTPEDKAVRFFQLRWPHKNIDLEKQYEYFWEWVHRFKHLDPTAWMDAESLTAYHTMLEEV